ncbi:MAG TPA: transglycosylase SLT domain-containing protein [Candidatus Dormibacteraeota bacterium]
MAAVLATVAGLVLGAAPAAAYDVQPGDTLWSISARTGVPISRIVQDNGLPDPDHIVPGQHLVVGDPAPAGQRQPEAVRGIAARRLLVAAAHEFGVNPNLVLAVSWWESGYDQTQVSKDGAVGLMQVMPDTARWAGPALLGRRADILLASDNARLGAALLRRYLDEFDDPKLALAAYYQGEQGTRQYGIYPDSQRYVDGIWALRNQFQATGRPPT